MRFVKWKDSILCRQVNHRHEVVAGFGDPAQKEGPRCNAARKKGNKVNSSYSQTAELVKPDIVQTIGHYVFLRKAGREYTGLCPFHEDKNPSFSVNEEKGVFYCFGCGESGDVIDFVMKHEALSFRDALVQLGMSNAAPRRDNPKRAAAQKVLQWVNTQRTRLNDRIRELDEQIELADEAGDTELAESFWRERGLIADLRDDLSRAEYLQDFIELKESIEVICEN